MNKLDKYVDWMSIMIEMDKDKLDHVDYIFICDVSVKDPRYKKRNIKVGENRGLFRVIKKSLESELLIAMEGDNDNQRYARALATVIKRSKSTHQFPKNAHFACG